MTLRVWDLEDLDPEELAEVPTPIEEHIDNCRRAPLATMARTPAE